MKDIITIGEAMIVFDPSNSGPMNFVHQFDRKVGGAELNFAIGCARLGLNAGWISALGNDPFGKHIRNFLRGEGVDTSEVSFVDGYPTSLNFKEINENGDVNTYYYRDKSPTLTLTVDDINEAYIKQAKIIHLTGIFPAISPDRNMPLVKKYIELAKKHNVLISFDPNIRLKMWSKQTARKHLLEILPHVDILLAGEDELEIMLETNVHQEMIEKCIDFGVKEIIIKRGEAGSIGYRNEEKIVAPPAHVEKVVDTVGAGDGFNAGYIYGYLQQWPLEQTLHFANTIGAMVVEVKGDNEGLPPLDLVKVRLGEKEWIER